MHLPMHPRAPTAVAGYTAMLGASTLVRLGYRTDQQTLGQSEAEFLMLQNPCRDYLLTLIIHKVVACRCLLLALCLTYIPTQTVKVTPGIYASCTRQCVALLRSAAPVYK